LFVPATMLAAMNPAWDQIENPHAYWLNLFGRLRHGVTRQQAEARIGVVWSGVLSGDVETLPARTATGRDRYLARKLEVQDGSGGISAIRSSIAEPIYLLMGMVGL